MKNIRPSKDPFIIHAVLKQTKNKKRGLNIWHSPDNLHDFPWAQATISEILAEQDSLNLVPKNPQTPFPPLPGSGLIPVFCREDYGEIIFKEEILFHSPQLMTMKIPKTIHFYFKRKEERIHFPSSDRKEIFLRCSKNLLMKRLRIIDISLTGIALKFHQNNLFSFSPGTTLSIAQIHDIPFLPPMQAQIIYIKEIKDKQSPLKTYRMGMKFMQEMAPFHLAQIIE